MRTREYLTETEVERLADAAKRNRYGRRDATMILTAYRHGLRAIELVDLRWDQIDFPWLSAGSSRAARAHTPSRAMNYAPSVGCSGSRAQATLRVHV